MDIYELIAAKRPDILALADRFAVKNIRIFGSVARQEATEKSDIDFLVEFPTGTSLLTHAAFQRELRELLGRDVDVPPDRAAGSRALMRSDLDRLRDI